MTLLSICQDVADVVGVSRPLTVVSSLAQIDRQLFGFAKETLEELSLMDWPVLMRAATINTINGTSQYALPADYEHEVGDTMYSASAYDNLRGQLTPGAWAQQRARLPGIGRFTFRVFGSPLKVNIMPTPTTVEALVYEYKTNVRTVSGGTTYTLDTDVSLVSEELMKKGVKWRIRSAKGLEYAEAFNDYEMSRNSRLAQQLQFGSLPVATRAPYNGAPLTDGYVREIGFGV